MLTENRFKFETALRLLPFPAQTRIISKRFPQDQRTALANQLLQRFICCLLLNTDMPSLRFSSNRYGKPQLEGDTSLQFSMSNQRGYSSMVVSTRECGIDLASCDDVNQFGEGYIGHFKDIFHEDEYTHLQSIDNKAVLKNVFTHYWALKESYTKKLGVGLNGDMPSYNFRDVGPLVYNASMEAKKTVFKVRTTPEWDSNTRLSIYGNDEPLSIWSAMLTPDVVVSVCQNAALGAEPTLVQVDLQDVVDFFTAQTASLHTHIG